MFYQTHKSALAQRNLLALTCILLLSVIALISASHLHLGSSANSEHPCSICVLAHTSLGSSGHAALPVWFVATSLISTLLLFLRSTLLIQSSWVRPPPAA